MRSRVGDIVKKSPAVWDIRYKNGTTADIVRTVIYADGLSSEFIKPGAEMLRGATDKKTLKNVFEFVRDNITYRKDLPGREVIQSPGHLFQLGFGDCKSYSVAIGALLRKLGYTYRYRFTGPTTNGPFRHVYVVATTPTGEDFILDAVLGSFNKEPRHRRRKDIYPGSKRMTGINGANGQNGKNVLAWLLAGLLALKIAQND